MKRKLIIHYKNREPFVATTGRDVYTEFRYWMGKSPGMYRYEIIRILSCPVEQLQDHTEEFLKRYDDEERAIDEARAKEKRRETYKQLKKEFEHES